jgi:hypothetical protein
MLRCLELRHAELQAFELREFSAPEMATKIHRYPRSEGKLYLRALDSAQGRN